MKLRIPEFKYDIWSDMVTSGLSSVGIDQTVRETVAPVVDSVVPLVQQNLPPRGGAIPTPAIQTAAASKPQSNIPSTSFSLMNGKIAGVPLPIALLVIAAGIYFFARGKK